MIVTNCDGVVSGASVTISQGGTTLASGTTGSDGRFRWPFGGHSGDVDVSYVSGAWSGSQTITLPPDTPACPNVDVNFLIVNKICVQAVGCIGPGAPNLYDNVTVTVGSQTCTIVPNPNNNPSTYQCCITLTAPAPNPLTITAQCASGGPVYSKSVTPSCSVVSFGEIYGRVCVDAFDCNGLFFSGATVTLNATSQTCTTSYPTQVSPGCCIVPNAPIDSSATVTVTYPGLVSVTAPVTCAGSTHVILLPTGYIPNNNTSTTACCHGDSLGVPVNWCCTFAGVTFPLTLNRLTQVNLTLSNVTLQGPAPNFFCFLGSGAACIGVLLICSVDSYGNPILSLQLNWLAICCISGRDPVTGFTFLQGVANENCSQVYNPGGNALTSYTVTNTLNPTAPSVSGSVPATVPWRFALANCGTTTPTPNGGGAITATPQVGGSC